MRYLMLALCATGCMEYNAHLSVDPEQPPEAEVTEVPERPTDDSTVEDTFVLDHSGGTIDVIVFGDTSGSMEEELLTLGASITRFVERLASQVADWQLAAVTGGDGCAVNGILRPDTPDFATLFAEAILTPTELEDTNETGLRNTAVAVEQSVGGCNAGLVRGDLLHVIYVSDENDESPGFDRGDPDYWQRYFDRMVAVHGDPSSIVLSAVAGPVPGGCVGAEPGEGYDRAVAATGGEFLSMCSSWADDIDLLVDAGTTRDRFPLSQVPDPDSIDVRVNGAPPPRADWAYHPEPNEVVFVANPPRSGDQVDIQYLAVAP